MSPELDNYLTKRYRNVFQERFGDPKQTCMCWGFSVGDGWFDILNNACRIIDNHIENQKSSYERYKQHKKLIEAKDFESLPKYVRERYERDGCLEEVKEPVQVVAEQVKEKFGTLRFYISGGDSFIHGVITMAEVMSESICEETGNHGKTYAGSWLATMSPEVAEQRGYIENKIEPCVGDEIRVLTKENGMVDAEIIDVLSNHSIAIKYSISKEESIESTAEYLENNFISYWNET